MTTKTTQYVRYLTITVTLVAFGLSYRALVQRALDFHIDPLFAWAYPIGLDGLVATAMLAAHAFRGEQARWWRAYAWGVLSFGITISGLGNALPLDMPGALFRLVPPLSMALALHLLIGLSRREQMVRAPRRAEPEAIRAPQVVDLPSNARGERTAKALRLLAAARSEGRSLKDYELAEQSGLSKSRARALIGERRAQASITG